MGGFVRYNERDKSDDGPSTLLPDDLKAHLRKEDITEKEIRDRSKGDILSKGFAILQTGWFVLQCIARRFQGLPITELEILTLAFAALNFATYGLWWNKPLDVQVPFLVRDVQGDHEVYGDEEVVEGIVGYNEGWKHAIESVWEVTLDGILHKLPRAVKSGITNVSKVPSLVGSVTAVDMTVALLTLFRMLTEMGIGDYEIEL
jgi:hypothetical protein